MKWYLSNLRKIQSHNRKRCAFSLFCWRFTTCLCSRSPVWLWRTSKIWSWSLSSMLSKWEKDISSPFPSRGHKCLSSTFLFICFFPTVWTWDVGLRAADCVCCSHAIHSKVLFLKTSFMQNKVAGTRLWNNYDVVLLSLEYRKIWMCPPPRWLEPMGTAHRYCASWI